MLILGLTGGIACGKSNISDTLRTLGVPVIDGDAIARALTAPGGAALPGLARLFGPGVLDERGELRRKALGAIVFGDERERGRLDEFMQPLIRQQIDAALQDARAQRLPAVVLDMPLLYEQGLDALCSRVWCAFLPEEAQLRRLMARDCSTREAALQRIRSQLPTAEKGRRADVVIDTSGSIEETRAKIPPLWQAELARAKENAHE